jgi:hypothetical protein
MQYFVAESQKQVVGHLGNNSISDEVIDNLRALGYFE